MEETESQRPHGPLYFEPLARALAVRAFNTVHDQLFRRARAATVPPGIRREIECLETDFANDLSIDELAEQAQLSRSHFALTFQCTSNKDHKDCKSLLFLYEQD